MKLTKLIKRINRYYFIGIILVFFIGLTAAFFIAKYNTDFIINTNSHQQKDAILLSVYKSISITVLLILMMLLLTISVVSKNISKKLWMPFYHTISQLKSYSIKAADELNLLPTDVLEFDSLNKTIELTTSKLEKDYRLLKEYTENVSHEIQTPLAIIKNKIELLLQDNTLNKEHLLTLAKLHQSTGRLSKLSKNLAVLTKIENNQFVEDSEVFLADFTKERLEDFEELIDLKEIDLKTDFQDNPKLSMNSTLAYLLFNNLISNAVRHNIKKGKIFIEITHNKFIITNTGNPLKTSKMDLFKRFTKSTDHSESTGLGLSMVKKIVSFYGFFISYRFENDLHKISVVFVNKDNLRQ